eukprot:877147-Rhodomonas_salina.1
MVVPKNSEYWSMGWRQDDKTAAADHDATLMAIYAIRWLVRHSPASNTGLSPRELYRKLQDDTGRGVADLEILTKARLKAVKKNAGSGAEPAPWTGAGVVALTGAASSSIGAGGGGANVEDSHVHGPPPGLEPSDAVVQLVEAKAMDCNPCLNCRQVGHCLPRCTTLTRNFVQLPCSVCYGHHWESGCLGPASIRQLWTLKRQQFFKRADHAIKNFLNRDGGRSGGGAGRAGAGAAGDVSGGGDGGVGGVTPAGTAWSERGSFRLETSTEGIGPDGTYSDGDEEPQVEAARGGCRSRARDASLGWEGTEVEEAGHAGAGKGRLP